MNHPFGLGRIPSEPDDRDHPLDRYLSVAPLPATFTSPVVTAILDQGTTPQCVAYSGVTGRTITEAPDAGLVAFDPHDLFALCHGGPNGTEIRTAANVLLKTGALSTSGPGTRPGERFKIGAYAAAPSLEKIKAAVYAQGWAWLGVNWAESWFTPQRDGTLPRPDKIAAGHAISVRGWSDIRKALQIQNSWGAKWGVGGWCWLPYAYLDSTPEAFATIDAPDCVVTITPYPTLRTWQVRKGQVLRGWDVKRPNVPLGPAYAWPKDSTAHADAVLTVTWPGISPMPMPYGTVIRVTDGAYASQLIRLAEVTML